MSEHAGSLGILRHLEARALRLVAGAVVPAWLLASAIRWVLRRVAEWAPLRLRLPILRMITLLRLVVGIGALVVIVPILVEPTFQNVVAIVASVGLALAFVLKDYASSLAAGAGPFPQGPFKAGVRARVVGPPGRRKHVGRRALPHQ